MNSFFMGNFAYMHQFFAGWQLSQGRIHVFIASWSWVRVLEKKELTMWPRHKKIETSSEQAIEPSCSREYCILLISLEVRSWLHFPTQKPEPIYCRVRDQVSSYFTTNIVQKSKSFPGLMIYHLKRRQYLFLRRKNISTVGLEDFKDTI